MCIATAPPCGAGKRHSERHSRRRGAPGARLRCSANEGQCIDEYAVLFTYAGEGITGAPISAGDLVELKRVRILDLVGGKIATETCIETWSVLAPA